MLRAIPKIGDIVRLNSGGPDMVVLSIGNDGLIVAWKDEVGAEHKANFPFGCVEKV